MIDNIQSLLIQKRLIRILFSRKLKIIFVQCTLLGTIYTNPVVDANHPDPGVLALPDMAGYVVVSTGVQNGNAYPIMTSTDLINWEKVL